MAFLTRDTVLTAQDVAYVDVECPEWGGTVRLRSITGTQRDAFEASLVQQRGNQQRPNMRNVRAKLVVLCAVDETGGRLFGDEDLAALGRKNSKPIDRLFTEAQKLCGLSEGDLEELTEDFGDARSDSSDSG